MSPCRVLIVAEGTAGGPELIEAVARRSFERAATFTLLVPVHTGAPGAADTAAAEARLELALPLLSQAAGEAIIGVLGGAEPLGAVRDAMSLFGFEEVMIAMLPARESRWFASDLPRKVRALGVAVTEVLATTREVDSTAA